MEDSLKLDHQSEPTELEQTTLQVILNLQLQLDQNFHC